VLIADSSNHVPRRTETSDNYESLDVYPLNPDGTHAPNFSMVMNSTSGYECIEADLDLHDQLQSLFYCGQAKPIPVCLELCAKKYLSPNTSQTEKTRCYETLMECCGCYEVRNKFFRIHPQWPLGELLAGAFYMEQPYPLRALKQDGNGGILCTFMVVRNIIDGVLVIVQGKYYDPATIGDMARAGEVIPLPEFMVPMVEELNEMKGIGGANTYRDFCLSFVDIPKNYPEGSPVATYHLCQLRKAIQGRLVR
jgi:hypothetical protein